MKYPKELTAPQTMFAIGWAYSELGLKATMLDLIKLMIKAEKEQK